MHIGDVLMARTDIGEVLPLLIVVIVVVARVIKALSERAGGAAAAPRPSPGDRPQGDSAEPVDQLRRFLEDLKRQAQGEPPAPPQPLTPPPLPQPPAARQVAPVAPPPRRERPAADFPPERKRAASAPPPASSPQPTAALAQAQGEAEERVWAHRTNTAPDHSWASGPTAESRRARPASGVALLTGLRRRGRGGLREAVVLKEVLGEPLGMRR